ncbi:Copine [Fragilaria crotonensis]|nr:Copine [Fragilaria crotonensis]
MRIQILLRAEHLPAPKGWIRKNPNTFAVVSTVSEVGTIMGIKRRRVGMTETVPSNFSPEWASVIVVDLPNSGGGPKTDQRIAVDIFHTNNTSTHEFKSHEKHDRRYQGDEHRGLPLPKGAEPVTSMIFSMAQVLYETPDWTLAQKIPGTSSGKIILHVETCKDQHHDDDSIFFFHLRGFSFPSTRRNFLDRPDFYFEIFRQFQDSWRLVYRSSEEKCSLSPLWAEDHISVERLCNHDLNRELLIRVIDMEGTIPKELGSFQTTAHGLMGAVSIDGNCDTTKSFAVMNGDKKMGCMIVLKATVILPGAFVEDAANRMEPTTPTAIAELIVDPSQIVPAAAAVAILPPPTIVTRGGRAAVPTFHDYARRCPIDWCLAIDFTDANGDVRLSNSAHYRTPGGRLNDYEWTMSVLGETLRDLNPVHEYKVWGFGGSFHGRTHSIFQCGTAPQASGVPGLLQAYTTTFSTGMTLGTSCSLEQVLQAAAHHAQKQLERARMQHGGALSYTILTILMVGSENDVLAVKEKIVALRGAPLSIFIVNMPRGGRLDDAKLRLYLESNRCGGWFNNCTLLADGAAAISRRDARTLSRMLLNVLHEQLPAYFQSQGIAPPIS